MASISSSVGLASGLEIESLVSQLMAVEKRPVNLLQSKQEIITTKLSSMGLVKSALSEFQAAAAALDSRSEFAAFSASVADTTIGSASASSAAKAGSYSLEVEQLATTQKVVSQAKASNFTFADGTLQLFDAAGKSIDIEISAAKGNNTLAGVRDAINASGAKVNASLLNDGSGTRLVITSKDTGSANAVGIRGLGLDYGTVAGAAPADPSNVDAATSAAAKDAIFKLDGITVTRSSNSVSDVISGVTLNLTKANPGDPTTLTIKPDSTSLQTKVENFVKAYNNLQAVIGEQTSYDATTKTAGALNGDSTMRTIQSQLRGILSGAVGGDGVQFLSEAGISVQKDGNLAFDKTKFQKAMDDPEIDVARLFVKDADGTGAASKIETRIKEMLSTGGLFTARNDGLTSETKNIDTRVDALNARMEAIETRYRAQFTALESTIASLNTTSSFLTQQIEALSSFYKSSK